MVLFIFVIVVMAWCYASFATYCLLLKHLSLLFFSLQKGFFLLQLDLLICLVDLVLVGNEYLHQDYVGQEDADRQRDLRYGEI